MKVLLILVDGMRPDALENFEPAQKILQNSLCNMTAQTVSPSVTLPCHVSLFHSVDPARHGTTTNDYTPQVRPIKGLCEILKEQHKKSAFFYNWEELRDLSRPNSLAFSYFCAGRVIGYDKANDQITDAAIQYLNENDTDFCFIYMGYSDMAGHTHGWMSEEYMEALANSWKNIQRCIDELSDEYAVIITADHGGHDRTHGTTMPEDMTIPVIFYGNAFAGKTLPEHINIKDLAPTITSLFQILPDEEWEGQGVFS